MNIIFMGTPDFAAEPLKALYEAGHSISLVITGEDKARGRGGKLSFTPVKEKALELGLEVITPNTLKDDELLLKLKELNADVFVVVAYGKLLPDNILSLPRYGCINIHASLLPEYRGAAPIQWAIIDGKRETGITTMLMDSGLDTGDILKQYKLNIEADETGGSLFDKLSILGGKAIVDTLEKLEAGEITRKPQGAATTHYASMIKKEMGLINWNESAAVIERKIRAYLPWPAAFTYIHGKLLKLHSARVVDKASKACEAGSIVDIDKEGLYVATGDGVLVITSLQIEGKKKMNTADFLRGYEIHVGEKLSAS